MLANDPFAALPFEVVSTTPAALLDGVDFTLPRSQPIQIVFSRPVIAIGDDWDSSDTPSPFSITRSGSRASIDSIASQRWVTTYILRLDPLPEHDGLWPTDLQMILYWNRDIQTWDGATMSEDHKSALQVCCESVSACGVVNLCS